MSAANPSMDPQRVDERERRKFWRAYDREHPPPKAIKGGIWVTPAWTGPDSPQSPVCIPDDRKPWQGTLF